MSIKKKIIITPVLSTLALLFAFILLPQSSHAAYNGARIIDNGVFLNTNSMSISQIQAFLSSKGSGLAGRSFQLNCYGADSKERQWYTAVGAPCDQTVPASHIIFYASKIYGINPQVVLATLQKEQSLVTSPNPTDWQINQAMGYGCPTTGGCGASNFFYQIDSGVWVLRYHYERANGNMTWWNTSTSWTCGTEKNFYKPSLYPNQNVRFYDGNGVHYRTYFIANAATSSMYCYTPHAYNNPQGLYSRAPYGTVGQYYSGSYNFVNFFEQWFGSTTGNRWQPLVDPRVLVTNKNTYKINPDTGQQFQFVQANLQISFPTKTTLSDGTTCLRTQVDTRSGANACIMLSDLNEFVPEIESIRSDDTSIIGQTKQWTCKISYRSITISNQCFNTNTYIIFSKKTTIAGVEYFITERDYSYQVQYAFRADRITLLPNHSQIADEEKIRENTVWTCKVNLTTKTTVPGQCYHPTISVNFSLKTVVDGEEYLITEHDKNFGNNYAFLSKRF